MTDFAYDLAGRLVTLTAYTDGTTGAETTGYAYNGRGLQTIVTYEETGDVTMDYDAAGNMTQRTDEAGVVVDYAYDDANRLTQRKKSGGSTDIETFVYDSLGRLITAEKGTSANGDAVAASAFTYDSLSRVNEECQSIAEGSGQSVSYAYDKAGNRTQMIYHGNVATANYAYDSRDRGTQIDNGGQRLADYTWIGSAIHQRDTTCDYPGTTKPKFKTAFERDGILRVTKVDNEHLTLDQATSGYNDLGEFDYTYDAASNPLTANQAGSMGDLGANRTYSYDTLNRLTRADYTDSQDWLGFTPLKSTYDYDDLGNRSSHKYRVPLVGMSTAIAYEHDKANRMTLIDGLPQGYDLAGNVTLAYSADRGTSYVYKYDHHNRLTGVYDDTGTTRKAAFTYDALGRRIEHVNDVLGSTTRYYYDGVNEIVETDDGGDRLRYYVHGLSYVDERLMMMDYKDTGDGDDDRPYYFTLDRMYNVRFLVDRAGALVERYMYDAYGRPHIRESCGRGDMNNETTLTSTDDTRFTAAKNATIWDPRADMDDDGDIDANDQTAFDAKVAIWPPPTFSAPNVEWAFSVVGNPFMFQGRPHFALDTTADATEGKLMLNDHRARPDDVVTGRWTTRDPLWYNTSSLSPPQPGDVYRNRLANWNRNNLRDGAKSFSWYTYLEDNPRRFQDPRGLDIECDWVAVAACFSNRIRPFVPACGPCATSCQLCLSGAWPACITCAGCALGGGAILASCLYENCEDVPPPPPPPPEWCMFSGLDGMGTECGTGRWKCRYTCEDGSGFTSGCSATTPPNCPHPTCGCAAAALKP